MKKWGWGTAGVLGVFVSVTVGLFLFHVSWPRGSLSLSSQSLDDYQSELGDPPNTELPEAPVTLPNLNWADGYAMINRSRAPVERNTFDNRLTIQWCGMSDDGIDICFAANAPEKYTTHFNDTVMEMTTGCPDSKCKVMAGQIRELIGATKGAIPYNNWTMCEAGPDQPPGKVMPNGPLPHPYSCVDRDCYDFKLIFWWDTGEQRKEIWSVPLTVEVAQPKTQDAHVVAWRKTGPAEKWNQSQDILNSWSEFNVTGDGRLMVSHTGASIKYSWNRLGPCQMNGWQEVKHISEMHTDSDLRNSKGEPLYGIAAFPMRDSEGNLVPPGTEIGSAYPWIDRNGNNLFFLMAGRPLYYIDDKGDVVGKVPGIKKPDCSSGDCDFSKATSEEVPKCTPPQTPQDCKATAEDFLKKNIGLSGRTGIGFLGSWSNGKFIVLDNWFNLTDLIIDRHIPPDSERLFGLYQGTEIRVGGSNVVTINSAENQFNYLPHVVPQSPGDVVWAVATNIGTDEVVFDNYIDPNSFIVSSMIPSVDITNPNWDYRGYREGFRQYNSLGRSNLYGEGFTLIPHVQNSATALPEKMLIPPYGKLRGGARLEPVAGGGVKSRGLFLDGIDDRIEYEIPEQPQPDSFNASDWYFSLWIDARSLSSGKQLLFHTPDGTDLTLENPGLLRLSKGAETYDISLPIGLRLQERSWRHIAVVSQLVPSPRVDFYLDGFLLTSLLPKNASGILRMKPGAFYLGASPGQGGLRGFRGWIDEFVVLARIPNEESICNHAGGTMVGVHSGDAGFNYSRNYPVSSHQRISDFLMVHQRKPFDGYYCESRNKKPQDYGISDFKCIHSFPQFKSASHPEVCIKGALNFPEGPFFSNLPRPVAIQNKFCLTCHQNGHPMAALQATQALDAKSSFVEKMRDNRRQPMEPPALLFGNVPGLYLGPNQPSPLAAPEGVSVDFYWYPAATRRRAVGH